MLAETAIPGFAVFQNTSELRTRRGQKPPSHADDIARRNHLVDEYVHNTQKFQTVKAEIAYQQRRVEWFQSEISENIRLCLLQLHKLQPICPLFI